MGILAHGQKLAIPIVTCTLPIPIFGISVFPFPWDSHGNGNSIPMHIFNIDLNTIILYKVF